jgi:Molecular chaperone (small heat shock protein)
MGCFVFFLFMGMVALAHARDDVVSFLAPWSRLAANHINFFYPGGGIPESHNSFPSPRVCPDNLFGFGAFFNEFDPAPETDQESISPLDISNTDANIIVRANLVPGTEQNDIGISLSKDRLLIIKVEKMQIEENGDNYHYHRESFSRSSMLPEEVNFPGMESNYEDGILTLSIPRN